MSVEPSDGGLAFPFDDNRYEYPQQHPGMTLRDWFAGQALSCIAGGRDATTGKMPTYETIAHECYQIADAMVAQSETNPQATNEP